MCLVNLHVLAGALLVVRDEGGVVVLVELARHIVGSVEQRGLCLCKIADAQRHAGQGQCHCSFQVHADSSCDSERMAKAAGVAPTGENREQAGSCGL